MKPQILILIALVTVAEFMQLPAIAQVNQTYISTANNKQKSRRYIGLRYRDLPRGLESLGGWIIGDAVEGKEYAISYLKQGRKQMLWLEILLSRDSEGKPSFEVIDVLDLPQIKSPDQLSGGAGQCKLNQVTDPEIIAIAKYQDAEFWTEISRAWRANRQSHQFERISPQNIVCYNPGWGV